MKKLIKKYVINMIEKLTFSENSNNINQYNETLKLLYEKSTSQLSNYPNNTSNATTSEINHEPIIHNAIIKVNLKKKENYQ